MFVNKIAGSITANHSIAGCNLYSTIRTRQVPRTLDVKKKFAIGLRSTIAVDGFHPLTELEHLQVECTK